MTSVCGNMMAQGLNSGYFTDDYKFRHTMTRHLRTSRTMCRCQLSAT